MKNSPVFKICFSGLLLALIIIFTRFLSLQNIPVLPFVRISFGPGLIIFASLFLGPIYGGAIGGLSDILGIVLVPSALGYGINPWFTLVYTLLGILPWCLLKLFNIIKNKKISFAIFLVVFISLLTFGNIYLFVGNNFGSVSFDIATKIIISISSIVLSILTICLIVLINKKYESLNVLNFAIISLISEVIMMTILNSIVKSIFFGTEFFVIFFFQVIALFINVPMNTFLLSFLFKTVNRIVK